MSTYMLRGFVFNSGVFLRLSQVPKILHAYLIYLLRNSYQGTREKNEKNAEKTQKTQNKENIQKIQKKHLTKNTSQARKTVVIRRHYAEHDLSLEDCRMQSRLPSFCSDAASEKANVFTSLLCWIGICITCSQR